MKQVKQRTNCLNCGSPLHYNETNYGSMSKCQYCGTEYHIDKLGRVEEYKVNIKLYGKIISFYVNSIECAYDDFEVERNIIGRCATVIRRDPRIKVELESYEIKEESDD